MLLPLDELELEELELEELLEELEDEEFELLEELLDDELLDELELLVSSAGLVPPQEARITVASTGAPSRIREEVGSIIISFTIIG